MGAILLADALEDLYTVTTVNAATYTVLAADTRLHVTYSATGACAITIPSALIIAGFDLIIKDGGGDANTNNITVATEGAETIDGSATAVIIDDYDSISLYSDSTNLFIY